MDWLFFDRQKFINYVGILSAKGEKLGGRRGLVAQRGEQEINHGAGAQG